MVSSLLYFERSNTNRMIKIEHTVTASPEQMEFIIEGMRNPMNSGIRVIV